MTRWSKKKPGELVFFNALILRAPDWSAPTPTVLVCFLDLEHVQHTLPAKHVRIDPDQVGEGVRVGLPQWLAKEHGLTRKKRAA